MTELSDKHEKSSSISCDVFNCIHNDGCCNCTAKKINIGPTHAESCKDTICATFEEV